MPEMDGFEATRHIHTPGNPNFNTPVFALTADVTADDKEDYACCFTGFLHKPIELDKMYQALIEQVSLVHG